MKKKAQSKQTAGRPPKSEVAPGVFRRGSVYWLRYSVGGEQIRVSLETEDPNEAIRRADERRGRKVTAKNTGRIVGGKSPLDRAVEKYQSARLGAVDGFGVKAADTARLAVVHFGKVMGVQHPEGITTESLEVFYQRVNGTLKPNKGDKAEIEKVGKLWKRSESTAQTYTARVATFATWHGFLVSCPEFEEAPSRNITVHKSKQAELITKATGDLKFILLCGFRAGMRKKEISMARPAWFDLDSGKIHIPAKDPVTGFTTKSGRARTIPLVSEFRDFIRSEYPDWSKMAFCIRPKKAKGKWVYRFDFRKMLGTFAATNCPELTAHVMRHSYASTLADAGVGIAQLASWTGDRIATLERHYLHLKADAEKAEAAFETLAIGWKEDPNLNEQLPPSEEINRRRLEVDELLG
jgi:integrase